MLLGVTLAGFVSTPVASAGGNYLILTPPDYAGSAPLNQFVAAKMGLGFTVSTHTVASGTSREAIRTYIQSLWPTPDRPQYVLIVGDTDGATSTANTIPHWVGQGSRHATTDLPYACMDAGDDWYPDLFLGRFSVRSVSMLQDVVDKSLFVEAGEFPDPDYVRRAAFLATDDPTAQAESLHDWVISTYLEPELFTPTRIWARLGGGATDITNAVNNGCLFVVYFGHSGPTGWSSPGYGQGQVQALANDGLYGLVMGWSCNTAHYDYDECFGETWLRAPHRGAAAYLSASNYVWWGSVDAWESSRRMERYFVQSFFGDHIWEVGPAWQAALWRILADPDFGPTHDHTRNIFEEMVLLGDPALRLPQGDGFTLDVTPPVSDVCTSTSTQAEYTIDVTSTGEFAEPVTLSVTGAPPGASVSFSQNSLPPPFTAELIIGGLGPEMEGGYELQMTGESASLTRSVALGLSISSVAPTAVMLADPPDGAADAGLRPTLSWLASAGALRYDLEVATNPGFSPLAYSATVEDASHTITATLTPASTYYWHVRASNGCGQTAFSLPFAFTTVVQPDFFTQQFTGSGDPFDLQNYTLTFVPDSSGDFYDACGAAAAALPTDPAGGTALTLGDDASVGIYPTAAVWLYGVSHDRMYVNANGNLTFNGGDGTFTETLPVHFSQPRIAALFDDLNPGAGGSVSWKQTDERVAITFQNVPEFNTTNSNTFQYELFFDGRIRITWLGVASLDSVVGLSMGEGVPVGYLESNLSSAGWCRGDLNCDGAINTFDIDPFVLALTSPDAYAASFAGCDYTLADVNYDGVVNAFDIDPFVLLLTAGE